VGWAWGSPNIADGRVFVPGIDGFVNCLDAETGAIIWRYRTAKSTCTEPVIDEDRVYFGGWDRFLHAFDAATGRILWEFQLGGASDSGAQIAKDGKLYVPIGGNTFRCIDDLTGKVLWEFTIEGGVFNASPAFDGETVYISVWDGLGMGGIPVVSWIHALDARTGERLWSHPGGGLTAPSVAGDRVYFGSTSSPFFTCVGTSGKGDGTTTELWKVRMGGKVEESCTAIAGGRAYILCSDGYLYGIS
jgi:outer membrane protein assembly factor BamB